MVSHTNSIAAFIIKVGQQYWKCFFILELLGKSGTFKASSSFVGTRLITHVEMENKNKFSMLCFHNQINNNEEIVYLLSLILIHFFTYPSL